MLLTVTVGPTHIGPTHIGPTHIGPTHIGPTHKRERLEASPEESSILHFALGSTLGNTLTMGGKPGRPKGSTAPSSGLSEQEQNFIKAYLKCGTYTGAALAAGFSDTQARAKGYLMAKRKPVAAAIAAAQTAVAKETKYDLLEAVKQMDLDMAQARKDKQLSALAKMHELKMKAHGLLVEKFDVRQSGFNVQIMGVREGKPPTIEINGALPALPLPTMMERTRDEDDGADLFD